MSKKQLKKNPSKRVRPRKRGPLVMASTIGSSRSGFDPLQRGPLGGVSASKMWYNSPDTYYLIEKYVDQKNGIKDGILFKWRGPIFVAQTVTSGGSTLEWGTLNTLASNSQVGANTPVTVPVHPQHVLPRGSPGNVSQVYNKYMFRKLKFDWVGSCATSVNAGIIVGFNPDGAAQSGDLDTISEIVSQPFNTFWPMWARTCSEVSNMLNTKELYYSDADTATDPGLRQSYQGFAAFLPSASVSLQTTALLYGALYSEGELILCETQVMNQNYAALPPVAGAVAMPKTRDSVIRRFERHLRAPPALVAGDPEQSLDAEDPELAVPVLRRVVKRDERKERKGPSDREKSV